MRQYYKNVRKLLGKNVASYEKNHYDNKKGGYKHAVNFTSRPYTKIL